jgi:hypothetical protein
MIVSFQKLIIFIPKTVQNTQIDFMEGVRIVMFNKLSVTTAELQGIRIRHYSNVNQTR